MIEFVSVICLDTVTEDVVVMKKLTGPSSVVGRIVFPGGKLERGETAVDAAVRELREEAGVDVQVTDMRFVATMLVADDACLHVFYTAKGCSTAAPQPEEAEKVYHMKVREYMNLPEYESKFDLKACLEAAAGRLYGYRN